MAMRKLSKLHDTEVWVNHYSSNHRILLVGEGDFSFSCSLATRFGSASNICASSLDSYDDVVRKYKKARLNLETLKRLGASLLHGVDATKLQLHSHLSCKRFDRVIFNFPHAGFHGKESDPYLIRKHRELVFGFLRGASHMLRANGEIHVSHKNKAPFSHWNLEELASECSLDLVQRVAFKKSNYPSYENKRGDGSRCDQSFTLGECSTFKFRVCRVAKELYAEKVQWRETKERESKCPKDQLDLSYLLDHNLAQVQEPLAQSRERTSPLGLCYYQEHRGSQFVDAYIRATEQPALFSLERNHVRFQDNSSFRFQDYPFQTSHHRQEQFLECSSRVNRLSHDHWTSFPHPYAGESQERRIRLLCQDVPFQARQEPFFQHSNHHCQEHFLEHTRLMFEIHNGELRRMLPRARTSLSQWSTKDSPRRHRLPCQDSAGQASQEPFPKHSHRFTGVSDGTYQGKARKMLIRTNHPHPYTRDSREQSMSRGRPTSK